jgi:hypothetical protein
MRGMFPALILFAVAYLLCVIFLRASMAKAPEAYEDESGFHYADGAEMGAAFAGSACGNRQ